MHEAATARSEARKAGLAEQGSGNPRRSLGPRRARLPMQQIFYMFSQKVIFGTHPATKMMMISNGTP